MWIWLHANNSNRLTNGSDHMTVTVIIRWYHIYHTRSVAWFHSTWCHVTQSSHVCSMMQHNQTDITVPSANHRFRLFLLVLALNIQSYQELLHHSGISRIDHLRSPHALSDESNCRRVIVTKWPMSLSRLMFVGTLLPFRYEFHKTWFSYNMSQLSTCRK